MIADFCWCVEYAIANVLQRGPVGAGERPEIRQRALEREFIGALAVRDDRVERIVDFYVGRKSIMLAADHRDGCEGIIIALSRRDGFVAK